MAFASAPYGLRPLPPLSDHALVQGRLLHVVLYLTILVSPLVFIEPSPYEGMMAVLTLAAVIAGVSVDRKIIPLIILLVIWNSGLLLALMPVTAAHKAVLYTGISIYLALNAVVYAMIATTHCEERLATIRSAYIVAACLAAIAGIMAYFGLAPRDLLMDYGRVKSTFKDPNVFGPFLVLPLLFIIQSVILDRPRIKMMAAGAVILTGLFLSFSRGAWGNFVTAAVVMMILMFFNAPSARFRARVATFAAAITVAVTGLLGLLLSIGAVSKMFELRAALVQSYDVGSGGRFTTQLRAFHEILNYPNGLGPLQYAVHFGLDPHDDYLNAFYTNGWIGGVTYPTLVLVTLFVGFRAAFVRTPWQPYLIAIVSAYFGSICEGAIVGTEHWRHYYLLLGLIWGLVAATENARRAALRQGRAPSWQVEWI